MAEDYDVAILGAGTAGLTAGMYAGRYGLKTIIIEQMIPGLGIINVESIENFPGFPEGIAGSRLAAQLQEQAVAAGVSIMLRQATEVQFDGPYKTVTTEEESYTAKALIISAGSSLKSLGVPGEEEFLGRGVSHCATCDGPLFKGQTVCVVGGGDSAADEVLTLAEYADHVVLFHRNERLDAQRVLRDRLAANPRVELMMNTSVQSIVGQETVAAVEVHQEVTRLTQRIRVSGVFIYVGLEPNTAIFKDVLKLDQAGHIPVNIGMETDVPGVYAAGDIRQHSVSQLASAAGDGATAAIGAFRYITSQQWPKG